MKGPLEYFGKFLTQPLFLQPHSQIAELVSQLCVEHYLCIYVNESRRSLATVFKKNSIHSHFAHVCVKRR